MKTGELKKLSDHPIIKYGSIVEYIDHMGDDNRIVDAARVSHNKTHTEFTTKQNTRLIEFLARKNHWSPYAHPQITFLVETPIAVARQIDRHRVGLYLTWDPVPNEISRRYTDQDIYFILPAEWREDDPQIKQGSGQAMLPAKQNLARIIAENSIKDSYQKHQILISHGVSKEQARYILPMSLATMYYWTGSLAAWLRVISLRNAPDAQAETREVAEKIAYHVKLLFPNAWEAANNPRGDFERTLERLEGLITPVVSKQNDQIRETIRNLKDVIGKEPWQQQHTPPKSSQGSSVPPT